MATYTPPAHDNINLVVTTGYTPPVHDGINLVIDVSESTQEFTAYFGDKPVLKAYLGTVEITNIVLG